MNNILKNLVTIASSQVGVREQGGNNLGKEVKEYQKATFLAPGAWPWCAAFVCWCIREWLVKTNGAAEALGIKSDETIYWRPKTAGAFDFINWAKRSNLYVTDEKEPAKAGDLVVFDFSHIGIVAADQLPGKDYIETIEGNTNVKGERDSVSGDGVWRKQRKVNLVRAYIRLLKDQPVIS